MNPREERGAAAVVVAICLTVLFMAVAFAIDIGVISFERQGLRNALDSGALAGAALLPDDPGGARSKAIEFARANMPDLAAGDIDVSYLCLVGDRDGNGLPDPADIPSSCDPGGAPWTCEGELCSAPCVPGEGDRCNSLILKAASGVPLAFSPAGGGPSTASTGRVGAAACSGVCGTGVQHPFDLGIIVDRTTSMSYSDLANVKAAAENVLPHLDPDLDGVALGVIHQSSAARTCGGGGNGRPISAVEYAAGDGLWIASPSVPGPLARDYLRSDGTVNPTSHLVRTIRCLEHSSWITSQGQTDLGSPIHAMTDYLAAHGRGGDVERVILFMTDGEANLPTNVQPCGNAVAQAARAKAAGIRVFTVGFGISGKRCRHDVVGGYRGASVEQVLADMATGPSAPNGCGPVENDDGDHYFCEARGGDLSNIFLRVISDLTGGRSRLIRVP